MEPCCNWEKAGMLMSQMEKKQIEMTAITSGDSNGVELGVFENGTGFLTGRGLASVCGVAPSAVNEWANEFDANSGKPRDETLYKILKANGFDGSALFAKTKFNGQVVNGYPEKVAASFIEYYAFESKPTMEKARHNHRILARAGLRAFIYTQLGFDPNAKDPFRSYHSRLLLNKLPSGVFSCFIETSHIVLTSIQVGLAVDDHTVPDISVGIAWSKYWKDNKLAVKYGERTKYTHVYPADYPQSAVEPEAWAYPLSALSDFRIWLDTIYLPQKYPAYLDRKVKAGALPASRAELLIEALVPKELGSGDHAP
jgi:transcriptional regulator with XRE-family HTH domain